jgi:hypothetical protein
LCVGDLEVILQVDEGGVLDGELVVATGVHQSRLEGNILGAHLIVGVVNDAASLELDDFSFRAFNLVVLRLLNNFNKLYVSLFVLIDDDFLLSDFTLGRLFGGSGFLSSSSLGSELGLLFSFDFSLLAVTHDLLVLRRSNHAECLHGVVPICVLSNMSDVSQLTV